MSASRERKVGCAEERLDGSGERPVHGRRYVSSRTEAWFPTSRDSSLPPPAEPSFRFAPSFYKAEDTGSFVPGNFEAHYEELFAEALNEGPITDQDRQRLDLAAGALGIDAKRLGRLEAALRAAYEARAAITSVDTARPDSLSHVEPMRPRQETIPELADEDVAEAPPSSVKPVTRSGIPLPLPFTPEEAPGRELHERFAAGALDEKYRVAAVLVRRGLATVEEAKLHEAKRPRAPLRPTQPLSTGAWSKLMHPEQDRVTGEIFSVIASAALLGRLSAMRRDRALPRLDPENKQDPALSTVSSVRALAWAAATMGMKPPAIYLAPERDSGIDVVTALPPAIRIGAKLLRGQSAIQLAFHSARALTWFRSEHFVCTLVPHLAYLEDLFLAALRIGAPSLPMAALVRARVDVVKDAILPVLEPAQVATLRFHVSAFVDRGGRTSLRHWAHAAELTAARAGLLLAGDLATACAIVRDEPGGADRVRDLETFWLSDECAHLRAQLGVALPTT
jgi:hypothetical protein